MRIKIPVNPLSRQWRRDALERELGSCAYERDEEEFSVCYKQGWIGPGRYSRFVAFDLVRLDEDPARGTATLTLEVGRFLLVPAGFAFLLLVMVLAGGRLGPVDLAVIILGPTAFGLWVVGGSYLAVRRWWLLVAG